MKPAFSSRSRRAYRRPSRQQNPVFLNDTDPSHAFFHSPRGTNPRSGSESPFLQPKGDGSPIPQEEEEAPKNAQAEEEETARFDPQAEEDEGKVQPQAEEEEEAQPQAGEEEETAQPQAEEEEQSKVQAKKEGGGAASADTGAKLSTRQRAQADSAIQSARSLASRAAGKVHAARLSADFPVDDPPESVRQYETWFGEFDPRRARFVQEVFEGVSRMLAGDSLELHGNGRKHWYAHVKRGDAGLNIWLGGLFWSKAGGSGFNSRAGTLIHELAHRASGRVTDFGYGPAKARALAASRPSAAVRNADNYAFFAESV